MTSSFGRKTSFHASVKTSSEQRSRQASRTRASVLVEEALAAAKLLEPSPGPLAALARYTVERRT